MHSLKQKSPITPTPRRADYLTWSDGPVLGYTILRVWVGLAFTVFGAMKLTHPIQFADTIVTQFNKTILPAWSVRPYALALPYVELLVGLLVMLGLVTRTALVLGGLTMISLTFGTALRGESALVGSQLLYVIAFFLLLATHHWNQIAVDRVVTRGGFIEGIEIGGD